MVKVWDTFMRFTHLIGWSVVTLFHNINLVKKAEEKEENTVMEITVPMRLRSHC